MQWIGNLYIFVYTITVIVLVVLCIKIFLENQKQKILIEKLKLDNQRLNDMYDGIRGMKHDFLNVVQALEGYVKCSDWEGIQHMIHSIYQESKAICSLEVLNPRVLTQPAIFNLMNRKYWKAFHENVMLQFEIETDLSKVDMDMYSLCRMLGIFMDNAIEAAKISKEKQVLVRIFEDLNCCVFEIENSYFYQDLEMERIFEKGYSSKSDGKHHGIGLWNVKRILKTHPHVELFTYQGQNFIQKLIIKEKITCPKELSI